MSVLDTNKRTEDEDGHNPFCKKSHHCLLDIVGKMYKKSHKLSNLERFKTQPIAKRWSRCSKHVQSRSFKVSLSVLWLPDIAPILNCFTLFFYLWKPSENHLVFFIVFEGILQCLVLTLCPIHTTHYSMVSSTAFLRWQRNVG